MIRFYENCYAVVNPTNMCGINRRSVNHRFCLLPNGAIYLRTIIIYCFIVNSDAPCMRITRFLNWDPQIDLLVLFSIVCWIFFRTFISLQAWFSYFNKVDGFLELRHISKAFIYTFVRPNISFCSLFVHLHNVRRPIA